MARRLNKNLIGALTLFGMVLLAAIGIVLLLNLPGQDPKAYEAEARRLEEAGEYYRAMGTYERAFKKGREQNLEYLVMAARCGLEDGRIALAYGLLERALIRDAELESALVLSTEMEFELARLFRGKSRWTRVLEKARKLLAVDDQSSLGHHALGLALLTLREDDEGYEAEGRRILERAMELDPTNADVVKSFAAYLSEAAWRHDREGRRAEADVLKDSADAILASAIETCGSLGAEQERAELEELQAFYMILRGSVAQGLAKLEERVARETTRADGHLLLANLYAGTYAKYVQAGVERDLAKAEEIAAAGLQVDPKNGQVYRFLGRLYRVQGKNDDETALYRRGLEAIPRERHFRSFSNNWTRVHFITELFLREIELAAKARLGSDETGRAERLSAAETWIARLKEEVPHEDSLEVRFLNAALLDARGQYVEATTEAEAANRMNGAEGNVRLQQLLAGLYMRRQEWGSAREAIGRAQAARMRNGLPESPLLYVWLGQVYLESGQPERALGVLRPREAGRLRDALVADETATKLRVRAYREMGQFDQARRESEALGAGDTAEARLRQAVLLLAEGQNDEAERRLEAILGEQPDNLGAIKAMLRLYTTMDRFDEARSLVQGLLAKDAQNRLFQSWNLMLVEADDSESREKKIEEFYMREEDPFVRASSLYSYYRSRSRLEEAMKSLDEAERLRPDEPGVIEAQLREALVAKDWERAAKYVTRHSELNIDGTRGKIAEGRLAMERARWHQKEGRDAEAKRDFEKAIETMTPGLEAYPSYAQGWVYLAEALLAADRPAESKNAFRKALETDPSNGFAHRGLVQIAIRQGDREAEREHLESALKFLPNDPWLKRRHLILMERDTPMEGIASREKLRNERPDDVENLVLLARLYAHPDVGDYDMAAEVYGDALKITDNAPILVREFAGFLGSEEVDRSAEGEALLTKLLEEAEDNPKKAAIAAYLGQFYESQGTREMLEAADRSFQNAIALDPSPDVLTLAAEFYTRTNKLSEARVCYEQALQQMGSAAASAKPTHIRIINLLLIEGDLPQAKRRIDDYIREYPDDAQGMIFEGAYYMRAGDVLKSKEAFDKHLDRHSDSVVALWHRGKLHILMERWQEAINDLEKAKYLQPDGFAYRHRVALADALIEAGRGDEAITELRSILAENPEQPMVARALVDAYQSVNPPRIRDAENLVVVWMRRHPADPTWPLMLGRLAERSGDWSKAAEAYEAAAEAAQNTGNTLPVLFAAYRGAGRPQDIIRYAEQKVPASMLETMPAALALLAWAHWQTGDKDKSFETYDAALAASDRSFLTYSRVVTEMAAACGAKDAIERVKLQVVADPENVAKLGVLAALSFLDGQPEEAARLAGLMGELAASDEDKVLAALSEARFLGELRRFAEAKTKYEDVLRLVPEHALALNNLAYVLAEELGSPAEALPYAEQAIRLNPNNADILDTLGWVLAENDRLGEAAGMLLRALEIDRRNVVAAYHLGLVHMRRKELGEARRRLNSALAVARSQGDQRYLPKITEALEELEKDERRSDEAPGSAGG